MVVVQLGSGKFNRAHMVGLVSASLGAGRAAGHGGGSVRGSSLSGECAHAAIALCWASVAKASVQCSTFHFLIRDVWLIRSRRAVSFARD
jgi:hypothetical protein